MKAVREPDQIDSKQIIEAKTKRERERRKEFERELYEGMQQIVQKDLENFYKEYVAPKPGKPVPFWWQLDVKK